MFKLYLFHNDYETSYTTFIKHARWHRCLRSDGLRVGGNRSARRETHLSDLVLYVFDASTLICLFYIKILIPSPIQHMLIDHVIIQSGELSNKHVLLIT